MRIKNEERIDTGSFLIFGEVQIRFHFPVHSESAVWYPGSDG